MKEEDMRDECKVIVNTATGECCGKPAVAVADEKNQGGWGMCAEHWDIASSGEFVEVREKDRRKRS
jgi:hypothetical protein